MLAFLKRRWILLSCAVVLLWLTLQKVVFVRVTYTDKTREEFGIWSGHIIWGHAWRDGSDPVRYSVPIGALLIVAIGLIVIRELRWREKRAKPATLPT